jgi:hypothetical protein
MVISLCEKKKLNCYGAFNAQTVPTFYLLAKLIGNTLFNIDFLWCANHVKQERPEGFYPLTSNHDLSQRTNSYAP